MLKIKCSKCNKELKCLGALILSPPIDNLVHKFHICICCYEKLCNWLLKKQITKGEKNDSEQ